MTRTLQDHGSGVRGRFGIIRAILRSRWLILYAVTIAVMIWWYEFRPARLASKKLQGTWRAVEGVIPDEEFGKSYWYFDGDETWFTYPRQGKWSVQRSRITLRPADNFFIVRRAFGFDYGNTRETEYILYMKNDELYVLRGLARLDPVMENTIEKLRSVDSLPDDAKDSIRQYLHRRESENMDDVNRK